MSATVELPRSPLTSETPGRGNTDADAALLVRHVPRSELRDLSVIAEGWGVSREAYVRGLIRRHAREAGRK